MQENEKTEIPEVTIRHEWIVPDQEESDKIIPPEATAFLELIKNYLYQHYQPATGPGDASVMMSTKEVYESIYRLYPSDIYSIELIANWLHDGGYTFTDMGNLRFEWMFKPF